MLGTDQRSASSVLVVDDNPDFLELIGEALADAGYHVTLARDGQEALDRVGEALPRLILLDMRMPVMDGWTFARKLRERYGTRVPIVVMTAAENSELRASEVGAEAHLGKPFELDQLYGIVEGMLAR